MTTDGKILYGNGGEKAFGEQVVPLWVLLVGISLLDMNLEDAVLSVNGGQFKIFQDELRQ